VDLNDAARVALAIADDYADWGAALADSAAARQLADLDFGDDVTYAARADRFAVVPTYADRRIT
jgi:phosphosulfolactate phosphohydrolase-like enzyme